MSSTDPTRLLSGDPRLTAYMDALRQQQQEAIRKLTLAQQQASKPVAEKTPPSPNADIKSLQGRVTDKVNAVRTTVQWTSQALGQALAQGDATAAKARIEMLGSMLSANAEMLDFEKKAMEAELKAAEMWVQELRDFVQSTTRSMEDIRKTLTMMIDSQYKQALDAVRNI